LLLAADTPVRVQYVHSLTQRMLPVLLQYRSFWPQTIQIPGKRSLLSELACKRKTRLSSFYVRDPPTFWFGYPSMNNESKEVGRTCGTAVSDQLKSTILLQKVLEYHFVIYLYAQTPRSMTKQELGMYQDEDAMNSEVEELS